MAPCRKKKSKSAGDRWLQEQRRRLREKHIPKPKRDDGRWLNRTSRDASVIKVDNDGRPIKVTSEVDPELATTAVDSLDELRGQVSSAKLFEFVLGRAETEAGNVSLTEEGGAVRINHRESGRYHDFQRTLATDVIIHSCA
jgi:hypothetical protein